MTVAPPLRPSAPPPLNEATRRAELAKMKRIATGLLVAALVTLVVARIYEPLYPWLGYIRATAEAAVVGGLADWFAVTALFRRPLGLPIPHTAIIPSQKDRIGQILGNFVQNHFINREVLSAKLHGMGLGTRLGVWLRDEDNAARLARGLAGGWWRRCGRSRRRSGTTPPTRCGSSSMRRSPTSSPASRTPPR